MSGLSKKPRQKKSSPQTPDNPTPEPATIAAIGAALLLDQHEAGGPFGAITYCEPIQRASSGTPAWLNEDDE